MALRIALFTPFSPETGGGAAQLRSHLQFLTGLEVTWYYLASQPVTPGQAQWKWLGRRFSTGELLSDLAARSGFLPGSKARVRKVVDQLQGDLYWVVGHYEGISVAAELEAQGKPVHLTVHDDPFGTWVRSERYRMFRPLLRRTFPALLRGARSVDVTSWGMRNLYRREYGVPCFSVYLHVPDLPRLDCAPDPQKLTIGHIGTLYHPEPFRRFLLACRSLAAERKRVLEVVRIGSSPQIDAISKDHAANFRTHGDLTEPSAIPLLASCDLLYAMYPPGRSYQLFRRTSLPVKLSTYIQAQRPVFAHAPGDSTLARVVRPAGVGLVCESENQGEIANRLKEALGMAVERDRFERLRRELMGMEQVQQLGAALRGEDWSGFEEQDFRA
jgi:hypothetical protein